MVSSYSIRRGQGSGSSETQHDENCGNGNENPNGERGNEELAEKQ